MGLIRSPLFALHVAAGANFADVEGWLLPANFRTIEEEAAEVRRASVLFDLAPHGVLSLVGPDARRFANGMFTNNIRDLAVGACNQSAMGDEKAKMQGLLQIGHVEENVLLLVLDGVASGAFVERYEKYILFDDVELSDHSAERTVMHLAGPEAGERLEAAGLPAPGPGEVRTIAEVHTFGRDRTGFGGVDIVLPATAAPEAWAALRAAGAGIGGSDALESLRVRAGLARWPVDMGERALVHEMRLVERCCSFTKGCYLGQEVINRIDVMGQVQKKLWGLRMAEDAIPPLEAEVKLGDKVVGFTRSGAREGGVARVLALLRKAAWEPGLEVEIEAAGRTVRAVVCELPFSS
jgi:tRNA-modifying protein YgfZ